MLKPRAFMTRAEPGSRLRTDVASQTGRTLLNLREMVLKGDFQPGERISELPLVARLGVSRTPIRLALDRLSHEGLLEVSPSDGFVVREFTLADIWETLEMRGLLEGAAARLAAERITNDRELNGLRAIRDEMDSIAHPTIDTFARYLDLNEAFHSAIVDLARSSMLRRSLDLILSLPFASPSALVFARSKLPKAAEILIIAQADHRAIVEALENGQGTRAEHLAREHARLSQRNLEIALSDRSILNSVPGGKLIRLAGSDRKNE
jgi:GntR family transcriptional regulator of vanillate catabolism